MRFKEFLLLEDLGMDHGSAWFYGNALYPSDAYDWPEGYPQPAELKFLLVRWKLEQEMGRKFHNLDLPEIERQKFTAVYSNTMPDGGEEGWKHRPDNRPNLKIDKNAKLELHGLRKKSEIANILWKSNPMIDKEKELNRLFGDFKPKYYELPKDFDDPWKNKRDR